MTEEKTLADILPGPAGTGADQEAMNRRQFLKGAAVGSAAGLAVAAGTGVAVWKVSDAEAQATIEAAEAEIARLKGLVDLYEDLETVGLDAVLQTGMMAVALPLKGIEEGAAALKSGLDAVEKALRTVEEAFPTAREAILWLDERVTTVAEGIDKLETALGKFLDKATDNRVAETVKEFAAVVVDNLPFGLGDKIRDTLDGLVEVVTSVDEMVAGINSRLLEPLREQWFSTEEGKGLASALIDPLIENVLDPLEAHLGDLSALAQVWQDDLLSPTEMALEQRDLVRADIVDYKAQNGFE
ncbi:twin-arginine translocation signal domain-containing protein [Chloroflexota bacterium]